MAAVVVLAIGFVWFMLDTNVRREAENQIIRYTRELGYDHCMYRVDRVGLFRYKVEIHVEGSKTPVSWIVGYRPGKAM